MPEKETSHKTLTTLKSYFLRISVKIKAEINLIIFPPSNFILKHESLCKTIFDARSLKFEIQIKNNYVKLYLVQETDLNELAD